MSKTIQLDDAKLPPAMAAYGRREQVAEIIYDWIHESQVTHRRTWAQRTEEDKAQYRRVAKLIEVVYTAPAEKLPLPTDYECIAPSEQLLVVNFLRGICDADKQELAQLHLHLCARCRELAGGVTAPADSSPRLTEEESQLVMGAIPLQALPPERTRVEGEPMQTFDYMCAAQPNCGWRSTDASRPLSRGLKVGCPDCLGDARFIGMTSAPAENFVKSAFEFLNTISGADICTDRTCIRCRIADVAFEVERRYTTAPAESAHRCPHCGRTMRSDFDEDVGMWYECDNCDYREQVSNVTAPP